MSSVQYEENKYNACCHKYGYNPSKHNACDSRAGGGEERGGEGRSEAVSEGPGTDTKGSTGP